MGGHRRANSEERVNQALAIDYMAILLGVGWAHRARDLAEAIGVGEDRVRKVYRGAVRVSADTLEDWKMNVLRAREDGEDLARWKPLIKWTAAELAPIPEGLIAQGSGRVGCPVPFLRSHEYAHRNLPKGAP